MKRYLLFILFGATLLGSTSSHAAGELGESGGNNDNPHNLSSNSPAGKVQALDAASQTYPGKETQICIFCHAPHSTTPQTTLWNREPPDGTFSTRSDLNPGISAITSDTHYGVNDATYEYPNGASKLCLSCHDGVTAIGILAHNVSIDMTDVNLGGRASEIDLTTSHPISFVYNGTVVSYLNGLVPGTYQLTGAAYLETYLGEGWVQCTSCHQPHQDTNNGSTYLLPFWRGAGTDESNEYNAVCQGCHIGTPSVTDEHNF